MPQPPKDFVSLRSSPHGSVNDENLQIESVDDSKRLDLLMRFHRGRGLEEARGGPEEALEYKEASQSESEGYFEVMAQLLNRIKKLYNS